jgi:hypothetical protein
VLRSDLLYRWCHRWSIGMSERGGRVGNLLTRVKVLLSLFFKTDGPTVATLVIVFAKLKLDLPSCLSAITCLNFDRKKCLPRSVPLIKLPTRKSTYRLTTMVMIDTNVYTSARPLSALTILPITICTKSMTCWTTLSVLRLIVAKPVTVIADMQRNKQSM